MHKTTKGALAAGTAAFLMLGGAGTLAFWTDEAQVDGGIIETGSLSIEPLVDATSGSACGDWVHTNGPATSQVVDELVPGDVITKNCSFTIGAVGENLTAVLTTPDTLEVVETTPAQGTDSTLELTVDATYQLAGAAVTAITEVNDGDTLTATLTVSFPYGDDTAVNANDTQDVLATLDELTVSLDQQNNGV